LNQSIVFIVIPDSQQLYEVALAYNISNDKVCDRIISPRLIDGQTSGNNKASLK